MNNKIYLAGQDVFRANAAEHFAELKKLCENYGFEGVSPFDNEIFDGEKFSKEHSKHVFFANVSKIEECFAIVANLNPFRGACVDDGTSFELGVGWCNSKFMCGYTKFHGWKHKDVVESIHVIERSVLEFPIIESFADNTVNLMLQESIEDSGGKILRTFEECLGYIKLYKINL